MRKLDWKDSRLKPGNKTAEYKGKTCTVFMTKDSREPIAPRFIIDGRSFWKYDNKFFNSIEEALDIADIVLRHYGDTNYFEGVNLNKDLSYLYNGEHKLYGSNKFKKCEDINLSCKEIEKIEEEEFKENEYLDILEQDYLNRLEQEYIDQENIKEIEKKGKIVYKKDDNKFNSVRYSNNEISNLCRKNFIKIMDIDGILVGNENIGLINSEYGLYAKYERNGIFTRIRAIFDFKHRMTSTIEQNIRNYNAGEINTISVYKQLADAVGCKAFIILATEGTYPLKLIEISGEYLDPEVYEVISNEESFVYFMKYVDGKDKNKFSGYEVGLELEKECERSMDYNVEEFNTNLKKSVCSIIDTNVNTTDKKIKKIRNELFDKLDRIKGLKNNKKLDIIVDLERSVEKIIQELKTNILDDLNNIKLVSSKDELEETNDIEENNYIEDCAEIDDIYMDDEEYDSYLRCVRENNKPDDLDDTIYLEDEYPDDENEYLDDAEEFLYYEDEFSDDEDEYLDDADEFSDYEDEFSDDNDEFSDDDESLNYFNSTEPLNSIETEKIMESNFSESECEKELSPNEKLLEAVKGILIANGLSKDDIGVHNTKGYQTIYFKSLELEGYSKRKYWLLKVIVSKSSFRLVTNLISNNLLSVSNENISFQESNKAYGGKFIVTITDNGKINESINKLVMESYNQMMIECYDSVTWN